MYTTTENKENNHICFKFCNSSLRKIHPTNSVKTKLLQSSSKVKKHTNASNQKFFHCTCSQGGMGFSHIIHNKNYQQQQRQQIPSSSYNHNHKSQHSLTNNCSAVVLVTLRPHFLKPFQMFATATWPNIATTMWQK